MSINRLHENDRPYFYISSASSLKTFVEFINLQPNKGLIHEPHIEVNEMIWKRLGLTLKEVGQKFVYPVIQTIKT